MPQNKRKSKWKKTAPKRKRAEKPQEDDDDLENLAKYGPDDLWCEDPEIAQPGLEIEEDEDDYPEDEDDEPDTDFNESVARWLATQEVHGAYFLSLRCCMFSD